MKLKEGKHYKLTVEIQVDADMEEGNIDRIIADAICSDTKQKAQVINIGEYEEV